jgi:hypothetical protein
MSPQGASVAKACSKGIDPEIMNLTSASYGEDFVPLFRTVSGTIHIVPNWKDLFPPYELSKASRDGETLSQENYYKRCVFISVFNLWKRAKSILSQMNASRPEDKRMTMFQLMSNGSNFSDELNFNTRQEFVSQQRELHREQKENEKQEAAAAASAKFKPSGSSNSFSVLTDDASCNSKSRCARGGSNVEEVPVPRCESRTTRGGHSSHDPKPVVISAGCRPKKGETHAPTEEQRNLLRKYLVDIFTKFGGLSTSQESFYNDCSAWGGNRADMMRILSQCGVNTKESDAVFQFLKSQAFVEQTETEISGTKGRPKSVLCILDKNGNVLQKESAATGGAASAAGGAASTNA